MDKSTQNCQRWKVRCDLFELARNSNPSVLGTLSLSCIRLVSWAVQEWGLGSPWPRFLKPKGSWMTEWQWGVWSCKSISCAELAMNGEQERRLVHPSIFSWDARVLFNTGNHQMRMNLQHWSPPHARGSWCSTRWRGSIQQGNRDSGVGFTGVQQWQQKELLEDGGDRKDSGNRGMK